MTLQGRVKCDSVHATYNNTFRLVASSGHIHGARDRQSDFRALKTEVHAQYIPRSFRLHESRTPEVVS